MLPFREFIVEDHGYNVPVVSISKDKVDLELPETVNEINRNLAQVLSEHFVSPYAAWIKVCKTLSTYGIPLPRILFDDLEEGDEVVAVCQFGERVGASLDGTVNMHHDNDRYENYLYFCYEMQDTGFYETFAVITDGDGLEDLIKDDPDTEFKGLEGDLDPRQ